MSELQPTTMKDIAEHFGVSIATVSRALNGSARVSEEKRNLICEYAHANNFYPNDIAKSLRNSHKQPVKVIGVIVSQAKETQDYAHFQSLIDRGIPLVFYDRICTGVDASRVVVDDYQGAFAAVTHLIETGCRRIAFYGMKGKTALGQNRYNGYHDALLKAGMHPDESLVFVCDNREDAERITPGVLSRADRPDAFFCVNDDTAIGVLYTAKHNGFRVPDDVAVCGFTNGERAIACDPQLTTVEQRGTKVGEEAATILMDKVEGLTPCDRIEKRVVKTRLVVRESTKS